MEDPKDKIFTIEHRRKIIGGLIALVLLFMGLWVKSLFSNDKKETPSNSLTNNNTVTQSPTIVNNLPDSTNHVTITQKNEKGDVSADVTIGNKTVYNSTKTILNKSDTQIINKGFLNQGGINNTYNQTILKQTQRHFDLKDAPYLIRLIPEGYKVDICSSYGDTEAIIFANEISDFLVSRNFEIFEKGTQCMWTFNPENLGRVLVEKNDSLKIVHIAVFSNKLAE